MSSIQLRAPMRVCWGRGKWIVPPDRPGLLVCVVVLVPWTAFLFFELPQRYVANNWEVAWGGFDIGLGLALAATAVALARRSAFAEVAAAITGTLLVCDVWFDFLTSRASTDVVQAVILAVVIELPLAVLCFWMAVNMAHAVEAVRPFLRAAGFTVENNRLVPPSQRSREVAQVSGAELAKDAGVAE